MSTPTQPQSVRLTKSHVDKLVPPKTGQTFIRDAELKGFAVRITASGARSFIIEKRINGRVRRFTIARYPELTVEQARKEAQRLLGQIATGNDPIAEKEGTRRRNITLAEAFEDFKGARKTLKPRTLSYYKSFMSAVFRDWQAKPLISITKDMVSRRHAYLGEARGKTYANCAMRFLASLFGFAISHYEDQSGKPLIVRNPVDTLSQNRAWYPEHRRETVITPDQLPAWYDAVLRLKEDQSHAQSRTVADYLLTLLFTGLRRNEGAHLRWEDVDFLKKMLTIADTKNGTPLSLPLSDFLVDLLRERKATASGPYVFPGRDQSRPLGEPYRLARKVTESSGVKFTLHDLRRTFVTTAEGLEISMFSIKRLVNHKSGDVTAGYVVTDMERLRKAMQKITDHLLFIAKSRMEDKVVRLRP